MPQHLKQITKDQSNFFLFNKIKQHFIPRIISLVTLGALPFSYVMLTGCGGSNNKEAPSEPAQYGCISDNECKDNRICVDGKCIDHSPSDQDVYILNSLDVTIQINNDTFNYEEDTNTPTFDAYQQPKDTFSEEVIKKDFYSLVDVIQDVLPYHPDTNSDTLLDVFILNSKKDTTFCIDKDYDGYGFNCTLGLDCNDNDVSLHKPKDCNYDGSFCGNFQLCLNFCPTPPTEKCNNKDDDCNGKVDESLEKYVGCGPNGDGQQKQVCNNGSWVNSGSCLGGGACQNGETLDQLCGSDTGTCQKGTQYKTCSNGQWGSWGACQGEVKSKNETCNNKDDNCDGSTDENLTQTCFSACGSGLETCINGSWKYCDAPVPSTEICNSKDDDCDGKIDENDVCCSDECDYSGKKWCADIYAYKECGNFDADDCLESSELIVCGNGYCDASQCKVCSGNEWVNCNDDEGNCIPVEWVCDGTSNCNDGKDEIGCVDCSTYKEGYHSVDGKCCIEGTEGGLMCIIDSFNSPANVPWGLAWSTLGYFWHADTTAAKIHKVDLSGKILGSIASPAAAPKSVYSENYLENYSVLWVTTGASNKIFEILTDGTILDSFFAPIGTPTAVAVTDSNIWYTAENSLNKLSFGEYKVLGNWSMFGGFTGMTQINNQELWISAKEYGTIMKVDIVGGNPSVLNEYPSPGTWPRGITFDGEYFWHSDGDTKKIYKLKITEN